MKNTVLMVIDIQNAGINNRPANKEQFIENVVQLIDCARTNDMEVIHVRQNNPPGGILETGIPGWEIYHEVAPIGNEIIIDKFKCSAFLNTNLSEELQKRGTENIIMAGMRTELCVDTTCRVAFEYGYNVIIPKGCTSTFDTLLSKGEDMARYFEDSVWNSRFAEVEPLENILNRIRA